MLYAIGQRWVSQTEPKLGLGIITEIASRRVAINFPAVGESRTYAADNAPISRVSYKPGDVIANHEDREFTVQSVDESGPLIHYQVVGANGERVTLSEVELNCFIQFTSPLQRLVSGHYDRNMAFRLRYESVQHKHRLQQSSVRGLLGSRTSLLPHQIYIADKVAQRYSPRVLLADEVGLGKTIEAGMILHAQLYNGLASRILIVVPITLVHQWLVEMLRRFNLQFAVFNRARYDSLIEEGIDNPFESEQLVICDLAFLSSKSDLQTKAAEAQWDLLVVDEAHHLHWSEAGSSPEYQSVESLATHSRGVLLLTATPEQAGVASHFARLRLLDPDRFHTLPVFIAQEQNYAEVSQLVGKLQRSLTTLAVEEPLPEVLLGDVVQVLGEDSDLDFTQAASTIVPLVLQQLLDQHGTGRVLFRNTRQSVEGFPQRILRAYPLLDDHETDVKTDSRWRWLTQFLKSQRPNKVLVICSSAELALALESHLRLKEGIQTAAFYEGLNIVERDRAAAYFADKDEGAQALICSEIGSEGRNFQFAQHLVLFDLPDNPDLLEQRIGRLDRIGQTQDIQVHVPYLVGSKQHGLFIWYDQALDAFTHSCAAGYAIYEQFATELDAYLQHGEFSGASAHDFIARVRQHRDAAMQALERGRDPLLELNSCNVEVALNLVEQIEVEEQSQVLAGYMDRMFNLFGVEQEHQSDQTLVIHPGEHMLHQNFPGLNYEEGNTLTYHRLKALVREDIEFLTWEHPMVVDSIEYMLTGELGNAALSTMSVKGVQPGTLFLEAIFTLNSMAPKSLQLDRFLPISPQRVVVDITGRNLTEILPHEKLNELCSGIKRSLAHAVIKEIRNDIGLLLSKAQALAEQAVPTILQQAKERLTHHLGTEIQRLCALQRKNPLIRDEEIAFFREQLAQGLHYIDKTGMEVQAMRVVINT